MTGWIFPMLVYFRLSAFNTLWIALSPVVYFLYHSSLNLFVFLVIIFSLFLSISVFPSPSNALCNLRFYVRPAVYSAAGSQGPTACCYPAFLLPNTRNGIQGLHRLSPRLMQNYMFSPRLMQSLETEILRSWLGAFGLVCKQGAWVEMRWRIQPAHWCIKVHVSNAPKWSDDTEGRRRGPRGWQAAPKYANFVAWLIFQHHFQDTFWRFYRPTLFSWGNINVSWLWICSVLKSRRAWRLNKTVQGSRLIILHQRLCSSRLRRAVQAALLCLAVCSAGTGIMPKPSGERQEAVWVFISPSSPTIRSCECAKADRNSRWLTAHQLKASALIAAVHFDFCVCIFINA